MINNAGIGLKIFIVLTALTLSAARSASAQNPIIRDQFSADPSARVFGDSVFLYPSHDIPVVNGKGRPGWFCMQDYHVFSSADLMSWTDHGVIVSQEKAPWADPAAYSMWAPDCIERNGKYYFYFPTKAKDTSHGKGFSIGVAIADKPGGPFLPQAEPIAGVHGIDPNVFIDRDGQAYLYWAEGNLYAAKLKENMLELASEPKVLGELPVKGLKEGPYLFQRKGIYYLTYPHVQNKTERLEYAVSDNPMGPFKFGGVIMDESPTGCWTNHQSIISFKEQWYLFYHHNDLSPDFDKNRSVRIDSLFFEPDGAIRKVIPTLRGVGVTKADEHIQPDRYSRKSETGAGIAFLDSLNRFKGWKTILAAAGAWVQYNRVDFGKGHWRTVSARVISRTGGRITVRLDGEDGPVVARIDVPGGAGWDLLPASVRSGVTGVHNLVLKLEGDGQAELDWLSFSSGDKEVVNGLAERARNPILFADVPDMSMIRVGDNYYMSSTTMHMSPGVPIMRSKDLVNWELVSYAYDTLADIDELDLTNGKSTYGRGSWASSLRYHDGTFYVSTFAQTTGKTYVFSTKNIEKGPWKAASFQPAYHDNSLFFDDDGRVYLVTGGGKLRLIELNADASGVKPGGFNAVVIENASAPSGSNGGLPAEGSQLFKINGKYYLFNITWPKGGMRTVVIHRADKISGPYEGRIGLQDMGVAQGGLIQAKDSSWYAYLFRDYGAVGRIPYLVPVKWEDGWPVPGVDGRVPEMLDLPVSRGLIPGIVASDEFSRRKGEPALPLVWQWNHNPDNGLWSVKERKGYLRLRTGRLDTSFVLARNTLTQRTIGPVCSGITSVEVSGMKDGDFAGLALLQKKYGLVGVRCEGSSRLVVMVSAESGKALDIQRIPLSAGTVFLKAECDFRDKTDVAVFYYSPDGKTWTSIGQPLHMAYTIPHFMGYRFGLFNYATKSAGGYADFDFFHITDSIAPALYDHQHAKDSSYPSLKEAFRNDFLIGTALNMRQVEERDPAAVGLISRQFGTFTPENNMKAALVHPGWDQYNFEQADEMVRFAEKYHLRINAHTLIWHSQLPAFVSQIRDADSLRAFFRDHITTLAKRYDGKVYSWDVVNEALNEDGSLRKSIFLQKLGDDYIVEAFRLAQQAAPHTQLYYNDYNIEHGRKREGAIALIKRIQAAGVRIDGIGIQGHWSARHIPMEDIDTSIREFSALGIKVMFTELDLSVLPSPWNRNTADVNQRADYADKMNPYVNGLPDSVSEQLARGYEDLFRLFMKYKDKVGRVTFWGVDDGQSWLNNFPIRGRTNYPLLFDRQLRPKPAFYKVIALAG